MQSKEILNKLNLDFLGKYSDSDLKRMKKKVKESRKAVNNERKREFYLAEYIQLEYLFKFLQIQNKYFRLKMKEEKERSYKFLFNEKESIRYAFYSEEYEQTSLKSAEIEVSKMECPEGEVESKFKRKQMKIAIKRLVPEQTLDQVKEWADQAYPSINDEMWEVEVEEALLKLT